MSKDYYKKYMKGIEEATNEINQRISIKTKRRGFAGFRDKLAFYKVAVFFAYGYISIIQTLIIFLGITPQAIENINGFFTTLGIRYQFPVDISSIVAIMIIIMLFIFGVLAMLFFGLYKREQEISTMQQPGYYLIAKQNNRIIELLEKIKDDEL